LKGELYLVDFEFFQGELYFKNVQSFLFCSSRYREFINILFCIFLNKLSTVNLPFTVVDDFVVISRLNS